jgi:hypothetical protein
MVVPRSNQELLDKYTVGSVVSDKGVTSMTTDKGVMTKWFNRKLNRSDKIVQITCDLPKGVKAINMSDYLGKDQEKELAIAPNTAFKVISRKELGDTVKIHLEALAGDDR